MKYLNRNVMSLFALLSTLASLTTMAQEQCPECNLPPQAIGNGGLTCEKAKDVFKNGLKAQDSYGFQYGETIFTLASQVYCQPGWGYNAQGSKTELVILMSDVEDPIDEEVTTQTTASIIGTRGLAVSSFNHPVLFNAHGDAVFSRNRYLYNPRFGQWYEPERPIGFFVYQCRVPAKKETSLICRVSLGSTTGNPTVIGYQVYGIGSTYGTPEKF